MRVFAKNAVSAKTRFWKNIKLLDKIKKASGEILSCNEIHEKNTTTVKTYGIVLNY